MKKHSTNNKRSQSLRVSPAEHQATLRRDDFRCVLCGNTHGTHSHHIIPRSQGGMGIVENLATVCAMCHNKLHFGTGEVRAELEQRLLEYIYDYYAGIGLLWDADDVTYSKDDKPRGQDVFLYLYCFYSFYCLVCLQPFEQ